MVFCCKGVIGVRLSLVEEKPGLLVLCSICLKYKKYMIPNNLSCYSICLTCVFHFHVTLLVCFDITLKFKREYISI